MAGTSGLDFLIGFLVSLLSSIMNAAGLNLLKLDHVRNSARPIDLQRNECARPLWHIGLGLYILSQLAGSTIALNFLKTQWVAPLGSIALIFNFVFAKILVGTRITKKDVYGTIVVMASVIWIVVFGAMNDGGDIEDKLTLADLKLLFSRFVFILYFSVLNIATFGFLFLGMYAYWAISIDDDTSGQIRKRMKKRLTNLLGTNRFARASGLSFDPEDEESAGLEAERKDQRLKKVVAMIMAGCGGMLASQTLLLAKSGVKLITSTFSGNNQFTDYLSYFILFVLVVTAVLQVYCLNTGLKLYDSVLVVPMFYGFYTAFGLINSVIYLDQLKLYEPWVLLLVLLGIAALIYGVKMLSAPKPDVTEGEAMSSLDGRYDDDDDEEMTEDGLSRRGGGGDLERSISRSSKLSKLSKSGNGVGASRPSGSSASSSNNISHSPRSDNRDGLTRSVSKSSRGSKLRGSGRDKGEEGGGHKGNKLTGMLRFGKKRSKHQSQDQQPQIDTKASSRGGLTYLDESGSSRDLRRTSMFSKTSLHSDPFQTPKDGRSISGELPGELGISVTPSPGDTPHSRKALIDHDLEEPTHILIDTSSEDEGGQDDIRGQSTLATAAAIIAVQQQQKKQQQSSQQPLTKIDTVSARSQNGSPHHHQHGTEPASAPISAPPSRPLSLTESALGSNPFGSNYELKGVGPHVSPPLMSPSQFKAHLQSTSKSPLKPSPMEHPEQPSSSAMPTTTSASGRPASVRWSTGNHLTMDKTFEDLNPFKVLRSNSHHQHNSESRRSSMISDGSAFSNPTSPHQHHTATFSPGAPVSSSTASPGAASSSGGGHRRQDSFTGLPSSFDVPGRKKRHSMLFGVPGEGPHSPSTSSPPSGGANSGDASPGSSSSPTSSPSQHRRAHSIGSRGNSAPALRPSGSASTATTTTSVPTTTAAGMGRAGDRTSASHMYKDHFFTGVPSPPLDRDHAW